MKKKIQCGIPSILARSHTDKCCMISNNSPGVAVYPSMLLASKVCPTPTPAEVALYPKVAVPCSVRTSALQNSACPGLPDPTQRFSQYDRYQPAVPCQPLPQSANMAGISKPSVKNCNLYSGVNET